MERTNQPGELKKVGNRDTLPKPCFNRICLLRRFLMFLFIPVTRRVKGYTRFVGKYVTGRGKRFRPHKVYIFLIRITSRVDLAMSVCPSVLSDRLSVCPSVCPSGWTLRSRKLWELGYWDLACRFLSFLRSASLFQ